MENIKLTSFTDLNGSTVVVCNFAHLINMCTFAENQNSLECRQNSIKQLGAGIGSHVNLYWENRLQQLQALKVKFGI